MAVGTAAALSGGIGAGLGLFQAITGKNNERDAERALNNYERQSLDNAYKNIQISTLGSDIQREESQRNAASLFDVLQGGGVRGIVGGIPKVVGSLNNVNQQIAKDIDQQFINREYAIAGDNARIEGMIENRDNQNIAALSSQANAGRQDFFNGLMGIGSAATAVGRGIAAKPQEITADTYSGPEAAPAGVTYGADQYAQPYFDFGTDAPFAMPKPVMNNLSNDFFGAQDMINKYYRF